MERVFKKRDLSLVGIAALLRLSDEWQGSLQLVLFFSFSSSIM